MQEKLAFFEQRQIRRVYDEDTETWWFSVVDIVQALTQQPDFTSARKYWNKLKERLGKEGSQLVTDCHQLKMTAIDGKERMFAFHKAPELGLLVLVGLADEDILESWRRELVYGAIVAIVVSNSERTPDKPIIRFIEFSECNEL